MCPDAVPHVVPGFPADAVEWLYPEPVDVPPLPSVVLLQRPLESWLGYLPEWEKLLLCLAFVAWGCRWVMDWPYLCPLSHCVPHLIRLLEWRIETSFQNLVEMIGGLVAVFGR